MYALNHVPFIDIRASTTGCCAPIDPKKWDKQIFVFDGKLFAKAKTRSFLHFPLNMQFVMRKAQSQIEDAGAELDEFIVLSDEVSPWHAEHYFAVSKEVPGMETSRLSGTYMTKVFEGPYKEAQNWYKQLIDYVKSQGKKPLKTYFFYTMCPKCAREYGKNYVVGFEQIEEEHRDLRKTTAKGKQTAAIGQRDQEFPDHWIRYRPVR